MKNIFAGLTLLAMVIIPACKGYDGKKAEEDRADWVASLSDSISVIEKSRINDSLRLEELRLEVAENLPEFSTVSNPREVEPYYILSSFRSAYPLSSTGIAARILKSEGLELVAALSGARFNSIRALAAGKSMETQTVPADQALNYTANGLTTVAFSGPKADSLAMIITDYHNSPVELQYLQNGSVVRKITLSEPQKRWVASTWVLCKKQQEIHSLESSLLLSSRKLQILKITLDRQNH
ncbi:MAG: hypothetical protein K2M41_06900 [Muribaculaceae bacterium]|nr:hypothetical protein [Muribaculaceae bacterium]